MLKTKAPVPSDAIRHLGVLWTGGIVAFAAFLGLLAILERIGLPASLIPPLVFVPTLLAFAMVGVAMRTMLFAQFDTAGRSVPLPANTVAIGTMMAGIMLSAGHEVVVGIGMAIGLFGSGLIVAPALKESGAATIAELIGRRHGRTARVTAALVTLACCGPALIALLDGSTVGLIRALDISPIHAIETVAVVLVCACVFGGFRGLSASSLVAGAVLAIAGAVAIALIAVGSSAGDRTDAVASGDDALTLAVAVMAGTFALPPLCQRSAAAVGAHEATRSARWAALLVVVVAFVIPPLRPDRAGSVAGSAVAANAFAAAQVAAMLAAAAALVFAMANTLSNDLHRAFVTPRAATSRQLIFARLLVVLVVVVASGTMADIGMPPRLLTLGALAVVTAGLVPVVLLGGTAMQIGGVSAALGILAGTTIIVLHLARGPFDPMPGSSAGAVGLGGAAVGAIVTVAASLAAAFFRDLRAPAATPDEAKPKRRRRAKKEEEAKQAEEAAPSTNG